MFLGINLSGISYFGANMPFLNVLKCGPGWNPSVGTVASLYATLDANGYCTDTTSFTFIATSVFKNITPDLNGTYYQGANGTTTGCYIFLYSGTGTFVFQNDFVKVAETAQNGSAGTGRIILTATPSGNGTNILLSGSSGGTYAHNFALVYAPTVTTSNYTTTIDPNEIKVLAANAGDLSKAFNPNYITILSPFKAFRFMSFNNTYGNNLVNWTDRTPPGWCFWGDPNLKGSEVPYEVQIALCNLIGADGWFNVPINATDSFVTSYATLLLSGGGGYSGLNSPLKAYIEFGNEMWLYPSSGTGAWGATGTAFWTNAIPNFSGSPNQQQLFHGMGAVRQYQTTKIFKDTFTTGGQGSRLIRLLADQSGDAGGSFSFTFNSLYTDWGYIGANPWSGKLATNFDAGAGSFYFNNYNWYPTAWGALGQTGFDNIFQGMISGGWPDGSSAVTTTGPRASQLVATGPGTVANGSIISVTFSKDSSFAVTMTGGNPSISAVGSGMVVNDIVYLAGTLPAEFTGNTQYHVIATGLTANAFELSATVGGSAITPSTAGSGITAFCLTFLTANDGTPYPVCDQLGNLTVVGASQTVNLAWTNQTINGTPATTGWYMWGLQPVGGEIAQAYKWNTDSYAIVQGFGLPYYGYEGGQQLSTGGNGASGDYSLALFYRAVNRNAGMEAAYAAWLAKCVTVPFTIMMAYNDIQSYDPQGFGSWGALENVYQSNIDSVPKYDALMDFINPSPPPPPVNIAIPMGQAWM